MPEEPTRDIQINTDENERDQTPSPVIVDPSMDPITQRADPSDMPATGELNTFDQTREVSEQGATVLREKARAKALQSETMPNLHSGPSINLLPTKTEEEIVVEKRTFSVNVYAAVAIVILLVVTIAIYGYNLLTKLTLNNEQKRVTLLEQQLVSYIPIVEANNDILARFDLYNDVQVSTFSPKEVLNYWRGLFTGYGELSSLELSNGLQFEVQGSTSTLREVAFMWHLLTINDKVSSTNLDSFSKTDDGALFNFEGDLNEEYFIAKENEEDQPEEAVQGVNINIIAPSNGSNRNN